MNTCFLGKSKVAKEHPEALSHGDHNHHTRKLHLNYSGLLFSKYFNFDGPYYGILWDFEDFLAKSDEVPGGVNT